MWVPRIIHLNRFFHCEPGSYWGTSIYNDPYFTTCCNGWTNLDASTHATPQNFTNMMISYDLTINIHHPSSSIIIHQPLGRSTNKRIYNWSCNQLHFKDLGIAFLIVPRRASTSLTSGVKLCSTYANHPQKDTYGPLREWDTYYV